MAVARVLIVGAGPTGLVLALELAARGVPFRIIEKNSGPGQASRALVVHARTLEFYRQLGFADEVVEQAVELNCIHIREGGKEAGAFVLKGMGEGLSPLPFALCFAQDDHERFLVAKLKAFGIEVEWGVELSDFSQTESRVLAVLQTASGAESLQVAYLCGCDGAHSRVRETLALGFPGGTYSRRFFVADVKIGGVSPVDVFINLGPDSFLLMIPVRSSGMERLVGVIPKQVAGRDDLTFEDVRVSSETVLGLHIDEVNWFSSYHVHHRVAANFRVGRCFLSGDAAHIHSPVGGQGMNTGIGDAVNLAWKLAGVLNGNASEAMLDTYEVERIAFARKLVATTDKAFQAIVRQGSAGRLFRTWLLPNILVFLTGFASVRKAMFRTVSQIRINYRQSALSEGRAGRVQGGDRLPWVQSDQGDNFTPLASLRWQVHVYGETNPNFGRELAALHLPLHRFPHDRPAESAGLQRNAVYLVRPDGHVALALPEQNIDLLKQFAGRFGLKFPAVRTGV